MTEDQIHFNEGYNEYRNLIQMRLGTILTKKTGHRDALKKLLLQITEEAEADHWHEIQREQPGITREEYENELEETRRIIQKEYYNANGQLKLRLVR